MQVVLTQETEELVKWVLDRGTYGDVSEVLEQAMRALADQEFERRLMDDASEAMAEHRRGETIPLREYTLDRIAVEAAEEDRLGRPISDDVAW